MLFLKKMTFVQVLSAEKILFLFKFPLKSQNVSNILTVGHVQIFLQLPQSEHFKPPYYSGATWKWPSDKSVEKRDPPGLWSVLQQ